MFKHQNVACVSARSPNSIHDFVDYYLSYNNIDTAAFGSDTTAIVLGQMQLFLTLNGDHRKSLSTVAQNDGLQGCIDYFIENIHLANKHSEHLVAYSGLHLLGQENIERIKEAAEKLSLGAGDSTND